MSTILLLILQSFIFEAPTQSNQIAPAAQYIVELSPDQVSVLNQTLGPVSYSLTPVYPGGALHRLSIPISYGPETLTRWETQGIIGRWQEDRDVEVRNVPNDPLFGEQWDMVRIGMEAAWNRATGGTTIDGDTIVVAILDTGFDWEHEDLKSNIWINQEEIPGDGIDNDQNGYIDDYYGVNVKTDNGTHTKDIHGTAVAGIVGARGGNSKGITGVNWQVKILLISGIQKESDIIEGYQYARTLRNTYRTTQGARGAYVVVTSLSAGIDNALAEDHPMWCEQYEAMGNAGIVSVCATTNANSNVDEFGDMPSTCLSDFMIVVTNTGMNDQKNLFAGYGAMHVDLGAPGTPTLSTHPGNDYDDFEGTSAAAPHVSGAVALLYSAACEGVLGLAESDPAMLARQMRRLILEQIDPVPGLTDITSTGGRLNVANAIGALDLICGNSGGDLRILSVTPNPTATTAQLTYHLPDLTSHQIRMFDAMGRLLWEEEPTVSIPGAQLLEIRIEALPPGVYYLSLFQNGKKDATALVVQ